MSQHIFEINLYYISGGNLGLFCGASFLSFIEITIWIVKLLSSCLKQTKKLN